MKINGKEMTFEEGMTVSALLEKLGISAEKVVVEINREILAKDQYPSHLLNMKDEIEIVSFVGGG